MKRPARFPESRKCSGRLGRRFACGLIGFAIAIIGRTEPPAASSTPPAAEAARDNFTTIREVMSLSGLEASRRSAVHLEGVVIYADPDKGEVLFKDSSGVITVKIDLHKFPVSPGLDVTLDGETQARVISYPDHPTGRQYLSSFEGPINIGTRYVARYRGFVHPPQTGEYTFWIASDNGSDLWLSTDEKPGNVSRIAMVEIFSYTSSRNWDKFPAQRSVKIRLQADRKYYVEAVHREELGEDCLAVAWEGPGISREVIAGAYLSPLREGASNGLDPRGSILREFWLGYPFTTEMESDPLRDALKTVESFLKNPPVFFGPPEITAARLTVLAHQSTAPSILVAPGQRWAAEKDFQRVEVEGVVSQMSDDGTYWTVIKLKENGSEMTVRLANPEQQDLRGWLQARVRVHGFCAGALTEKGERIAAELWVSGPREVSLQPPRDGDWSQLPLVSLWELNFPAAPVQTGQRIRTAGRVLATKADGSLVIRDPVSRFSGFVSADGSAWTQIGDAVEIAMNQSVYAGILAFAPSDNLATVTFDHLSMALKPGTGVDVGQPILHGESEGNSAGITVRGVGNVGNKGEVDPTRDDFHFLFGRLEGDGEIVARINSVVAPRAPWPGEFGGIMIRDTLDPKSTLSCLIVGATSGTTFLVRRGSGYPIEGFPDGNFAPYWAKLVRESPPPMVARSSQILDVLPGQTVELMGIVTRSNQEWVLEQAFFRRVDESAETKPEGPQAREIATAQQLRQLTARELNQSGPARIRGVITAKTADLYLQDATGGIRIPASAWQKFGTFEPGQIVEIAGHSKPGGYSPVLEPGQEGDLVLVGKGRMPEPHSATWNLLMQGKEDAQWIEVKGVVRSIQDRTLKLQMSGGQIQADLGFDFPMKNARQIVDATVRIQGVCSVLANEKKQLVGIRLIVPAAEFIVIDEAPAADPFAVTAQVASQLQQFDGKNDLQHRVKIEGIVTCTRAGFFYLQDPTGGVRVESDQTAFRPGDQVEVIGFSDGGGLSVNLTDTLARKTGEGPLPSPMTLAPGKAPQALQSSRLVTMTAVVLGHSLMHDQEVLQLQSGGIIFQSSLPKSHGSLPEIEAGSLVRLTGVNKVTPRNSVTVNRNDVEFELLLSSPADLAVLAKPDWWNLRRLLWVGGIFLTGFGIAAAWIMMVLRKNRLLRTARAQLQQANDELEIRVTHRTADLGQANASLKDEITGHKRTEHELEQRTGSLQVEIEERKRMQLEIEQVHRQLLQTSHQAGMAEVATSVLHNVGNVLNSVNVSATLVANRVRQSKATSLSKVCALLDEHKADIATFLSTNPKGQMIPAYLASLAESMAEERTTVMGELDNLSGNIEHIKEIVAMQQNYARPSAFTETVSLPDLIEDALRMDAESFGTHGIALVRDYQKRPMVTLDKHKLMQIVINLVRNARKACGDSGRIDKQVTVRITAGGRSLWVSVVDNGVGIPPENLTRIFQHGFTTRKNGHGFGLHSAALAAGELGGTLTVHSEGIGQGATFVLELPCKPEDFESAKPAA